MIKRRRPETILAAVISVVLFAVAFSIAGEHGLWAFALGFFGLTAAGYAITGPASGPCPLCRAMNHNLYMLGRGDVEE